MNLPEPILKALRQAPDYSVRFTSRVAALAEEIGVAIGTTVSHDTDMNYRHGQSLAFIVTDRSVPRPAGRRPLVEVRLYISSRGALFAVYCFDLKSVYMPPGGLNHPLPWELLPPFAKFDIDICRGIMEQRGYAEISPSLFKEPAPGCTTTMDDLPANVFEALFAEVV